MTPETAADSPSDETAIRESLVTAVQRLGRLGHNSGCSGNVSVRRGATVWITPSAIEPETLDSSQIAVVDIEQGSSRGPQPPSSELALHLALYAQRSDAGSVVHTHSLHATALACCRRSIPPIHYQVVETGAQEVPCTPWATPGTSRLAELAADALASADACLLANHGQLAIGKTLAEALHLSLEVERLAQLYCLSLSVGTPAPLSPQELDDVVARYPALQKNLQERAAIVGPAKEKR